MGRPPHHPTPPQSHAGEGAGAPREGTRHTRSGPRASLPEISVITSPHHNPAPARVPALPRKTRATRGLARGHPCPHSPCVAYCTPQPWVGSPRQLGIDATWWEASNEFYVSNKRSSSGQGCPRTTIALPASGATSPCNSRLPSQPEL